MTTRPQGGRDRHLDGLRGVAALFVVVEHFSRFLLLDRWQRPQGASAQFLAHLIHLPIESGNLAVYVFFAISGVVVANAAQNKPWPLSLLGRYGRLTTPMLAASLLAWGLFAIFPSSVQAIDAVSHNRLVREVYQNGAPSAWATLREPLYAAFLYGDQAVNPVLWSMQIELWGSFGILTIYALAPERRRLAVNLAVAVVLILTGLWRYLAFPAGAAIYELNLRGQFGWRRRLGVIAIVGGILLGVAVNVSAVEYYWSVLSPPIWHGAKIHDLLSSAAGLLIVAGVLASETSKAVFIGRVPLFLGRISYALYLIHMPLLYTAYAELYLRLGTVPNIVSVFGWTVAFFAGVFVVALGFAVVIDEPATRLFRIRRRPSGGEATPPSIIPSAPPAESGQLSQTI